MCRMFRLTNAWILLVALAAAVGLAAIAACGGGGDTKGASEPGATAPTAVYGAPNTPTPAARESVPNEIEAGARKLLEDEVGEGDFSLTSSAGMQWSDASLGCPKEGFAYAQVITPGYKLVFDLAGVSLPGPHQRRRFTHGTLPRRAVAFPRLPLPLALGSYARWLFCRCPVKMSV